MNWKPISLDTFIPQLPKIWNENFSSVERYIDLIYDGSRGILLKPLETSGRVRAASGEFTTVQVDNLIVRNQFTNLYSNSTTADLDFVTSFTGADVSTRIATQDPSVLIWPYEPSAFVWVDVNQPYYKISNDVSIGFQNSTIGQEFRIIFDPSVSGSSPYTILLSSVIDPSLGDSSVGVSVLNVTVPDSSATWIKLITTSWDASNGPTWTVKEYAGTYTISEYKLS